MDTKATLGLREQVMINQLVSIAGCTSDEAKLLLSKSQWQFESALSLFLSDQCSPAGMRLGQTHYFNQVPSNTPATPPNFPETLLAFSKLSAADIHSKVSGNNGVGITVSAAAPTTASFAPSASTQQWSTNN